MSLVKKNGVTSGWTGYDLVSQIGTLTLEACNDQVLIEDVKPETIVTADTTAFHAVDLFASTTWYFFFVLDNNQIIGTLHFSDFFKLPFRLCLFSLTLQVESAALDLVLQKPRESWSALPDGRKAVARAVFQKRFSKLAEDDCFDELLRSTLFCDKGTIIRKLKLASAMSGAQVDAFFAKAERIRNACAHTTTDNELTLDRLELKQFISDAHHWVDLLTSISTGSTQV
jgi:hypothetical protein